MKKEKKNTKRQEKKPWTYHTNQMYETFLKRFRNVETVKRFTVSKIGRTLAIMNRIRVTLKSLRSCQVRMNFFSQFLNEINDNVLLKRKAF